MSKVATKSGSITVFVLARCAVYPNKVFNFGKTIHIFLFGKKIIFGAFYSNM